MGTFQYSPYIERARRAAADTEHVEPLGGAPSGITSDEFNALMSTCWQVFEQTMTLTDGDRNQAERAFDAMKRKMINELQNRGGKHGS